MKANKLMAVGAIAAAFAIGVSTADAARKGGAPEAPKEVGKMVGKEPDMSNATHAAHYEKNLVQFIKALRKDFNAPNAKFVLGTLGEAKKGSDGNGGKVLEGHLAVDGDSGRYPEFKGNVKTVYTNPLSKGGSGNGHYGSNSETYMNVVEGMGQAMVELLKNK